MVADLFRIPLQEDSAATKNEWAALTGARSRSEIPPFYFGAKVRVEYDPFPERVV